jgi:hypothetical protein
MEYGAAETLAEAASLCLRHTSMRRFKNNCAKENNLRKSLDREIRWRG